MFTLLSFSCRSFLNSTPFLLCTVSPPPLSLSRSAPTYVSQGLMHHQVSIHVEVFDTHPQFVLSRGKVAIRPITLTVYLLYSRKIWRWIKFAVWAYCCLYFSYTYYRITGIMARFLTWRFGDFAEVLDFKLGNIVILGYACANCISHHQILNSPISSVDGFAKFPTILVYVYTRILYRTARFNLLF